MKRIIFIKGNFEMYLIVFKFIRTGHILPKQANSLRAEMDNIIAISNERKMILNPIRPRQ